MSKQLRLAAEGDAPSIAPESIVDALDAGPREVLAAMRFALAAQLDAGLIASNAIASAYKELRELDRQVRAFDAAHEQEDQRRASSTRRTFSAAAL